MPATYCLALSSGWICRSWRHKCFHHCRHAAMSIPKYCPCRTVPWYPTPDRSTAGVMRITVHYRTCCPVRSASLADWRIATWKVARHTLSARWAYLVRRECNRSRLRLCRWASNVPKASVLGDRIPSLFSIYWFGMRFDVLRQSSVRCLRNRICCLCDWYLPKGLSRHAGQSGLHNHKLLLLVLSV